MKKLILFIASLCSLFATAQTSDSSKNVKYLAIPVLFRTPETGWAYGLSASANFKTTNRRDTLTRTSVITALGIFSQREQNVQGIDATIYFPKEKYILYFQSSHSYFPDKFWGIGNNTKNTNEEKYAFEQLVISPHLKRRVFKRLFVGVIADYQSVLKVNYKQAGVFDTSLFIGKSPYQVLGYGLTLSYDTRNYAFWPTKGFFVQSQYLTYNKGFVSDYSFQKWMMEARVFIPLFKGHILAAQVYNCTTFGDTPYRSLINLGGQGNLRGFYQGRYRDKAMYSGIMEYRAHLFWKISAVAFVGAGDVYNDFNKINTNTIKYSYGAGLRLSVLEKEKLNLRIDYGYFDKYNKGFYFTVGECF